MDEGDEAALSLALQAGEGAQPPRLQHLLPDDGLNGSDDEEQPQDIEYPHCGLSSCDDEACHGLYWSIHTRCLWG